MGIQQTLSVIPLVSHEVFFGFILVWTFLNVTSDRIWRVCFFSLVLYLISPKQAVFPYYFCASNRHLSCSTNLEARTLVSMHSLLWSFWYLKAPEPLAVFSPFTVYFIKKKKPFITFFFSIIVLAMQFAN